MKNPLELLNKLKTHTEGFDFAVRCDTIVLTIEQHPPGRALTSHVSHAHGPVTLNDLVRDSPIVSQSTSGVWL